MSLPIVSPNEGHVEDVVVVACPDSDSEAAVSAVILQSEEEPEIDQENIKPRRRLFFAPGNENTTSEEEDLRPPPNKETASLALDVARSGYMKTESKEEKLIPRTLYFEREDENLIPVPNKETDPFGYAKYVKARVSVGRVTKRWWRKKEIKKSLALDPEPFSCLNYMDVCLVRGRHDDHYVWQLPYQYPHDSMFDGIRLPNPISIKVYDPSVDQGCLQNKLNALLVAMDRLEPVFIMKGYQILGFHPPVLARRRNFWSLITTYRDCMMAAVKAEEVYLKLGKFECATCRKQMPQDFVHQCKCCHVPVHTECANFYDGFDYRVRCHPCAGKEGKNAPFRKNGALCAGGPAWTWDARNRYTHIMTLVNWVHASDVLPETLGTLVDPLQPIPAYSDSQITEKAARMIVALGIHNLNTMGTAHQDIVETWRMVTPPFFLHLGSYYLEACYDLFTEKAPPYDDLTKLQESHPHRKKLDSCINDITEQIGFAYKDILDTIRNRVYFIHLEHRRAGTDRTNHDYAYLIKAYTCRKLVSFRDI